MNWRVIVLAVLAALISFGPAEEAHAQIDPLTGRQMEPVGVYAFKHRPRKMVDFETQHPLGTILVNTAERKLHLVMDDNKAMRYDIGVGREGYTFSGTFPLTRKAEWPSWTPTPAMHQLNPNLPKFMPGGPRNPMGARALYIGNTLYRIHGTPQAWSAGRDMSSGCIRMTNDDVKDLYKRSRIGATIIVE